MNLDAALAYGGAALTGFLAVGALLRAHRAVDRWAFVSGMAVFTMERGCTGLMAGATLPAEMYYWQLWRMTAAAFLPGIWLLFSLSYARGDARKFLRNWRYAILAAFLIPTGAVFFFQPGLVVSTEAIPGESLVFFRIGTAGTVLYLVQLITALLVLMNLERTFRAAIGTVRWRIKFMLLGLGVLFLVRLYTASQALLFRGIDPALQSLNSVAMIVACLLILRTLFRAGHFGRDVYPSHSVLQGSVTILLVGTYLLVVGIFAKIVVYLGGDASFAVKTLVVFVLLVVLAVLLQSDRVRLHLRRFISRHFQRPLYDYGTMWRKFTEGTASRVEQTDLCRALVGLISEMFQALSVSIWLVDDKKDSLNFAASTSLPGAVSRHPFPEQGEALEVIHHFQSHPDPVDIDLARGDWAAALRRWQPGEFPNGGHRVCIPLIGRGEVLALIILGDRVGGALFTLQDFDMLKCVADHAAGCLLNVQLSQNLLQAKEHEAFQTMAAFFVHDLKNAASTLNLMLQNLPEHFDDPAFREDALRGVGKSVAHINHLISRLSQLRHELKISPRESDLNEVVAGVVTEFAKETGFVIELNPGALPRVLLDREQFAKVVTNLILNGSEAMAGSGRLQLATSQAGGWAVLSATDQGCGMSAEFLAKSLFRPFQTTKRSGLGIGMFQSKMIVEAHGGRIAVESTPGQGTTFRVLLPLTPRTSIL